MAKIYSAIKSRYFYYHYRYEYGCKNDSDPDSWNENERRLFVWFVLCYAYLLEQEQRHIVTIPSLRPLKHGQNSPLSSSTKSLSFYIFNTSTCSNPRAEWAGQGKKTNFWSSAPTKFSLGNGTPSPRRCFTSRGKKCSGLPSIAVRDGLTT